jgi:hypothetical protein
MLLEMQKLKMHMKPLLLAIAISTLVLIFHIRFKNMAVLLNAILLPLKTIEEAFR